MQPLNRIVILIAVLLLTNVQAEPQGRCMFQKTRPITLAGDQRKHIGFGNTKRDFHFKGDYQAHGSKISVYITDVENYAKQINGEKFEALYGAKKVTKGDFGLDLPMGNYHLVWWNESTNKTVVIEAEVCFVHPEE